MKRNPAQPVTGSAARLTLLLVMALMPALALCAAEAPAPPPPPVPVAPAMPPPGPRLALSTRFDTVPVPPRPVFVCASPIKRPLIDGWIGGEPCWNDQVRVGDLSLVTGGAELDETTTVWATADTRAFYVAFQCHDAGLAQMRPAADAADPDAFLDAAVVVLQPRRPGGRVYAFEVNPFGQVRERQWPTTARRKPRLPQPVPPGWAADLVALVAAGDDPAGIGAALQRFVVERLGPQKMPLPRGWRAAAGRGDKQWTAEIAIPYETVGLDTPPLTEVWGANFVRRAPATGQTGAWSATRGSILAPHRLGYVRFLPGDAPTDDLLEAYTDRDSYADPGEPVRLLLAINAPADALAGQTLQLRLLPEDIPGVPGTDPIAEDALTGLAGNVVEIILNPKVLTPGRRRIEVRFEAKGRPTAVAGATFVLNEAALGPLPPPRAIDPIKLTVPPQAAAYPSWPLATAIPFPRGMLNDAGRLHLVDNEENDVPCGFTARAWWGDGSVRWVGLDLLPPVDTRRSRTYTVKALSPFEMPRVPTPLVTGSDVTKELMSINGGRGSVLFSVATRWFSGINKLHFDSDANGAFTWRERCIDPAADSGLYAVDGNGRRYLAAADPDARVVIEEKSVTHLVVRAEGRLMAEKTAEPPPAEAAAAGDKEKKPAEKARGSIGRFVTQIHAYGGQRYLRIENAIILDDNAEIADAGFRLPVNVGEKADAVFSIDGGVFRHPLSVGEQLSLVQDRPDHCALRWLGRTTPPLDEGHRVHWGGLVGERASVIMLVRQAAERYPCELEVDDGCRLVAHLWPGHALPTDRAPAANAELVGDLPFFHAGRTLKLDVPRSWCESLPNLRDRADFRGILAARRNDPAGVTLEQELLITFSAGFDAASAGAMQKLFDRPPAATVAPNTWCGDLLLGPVAPRADKGAPELDQAVTAAFDRLVALEARRPALGMFCFGGLRNHRLDGDDDWSFFPYWRVNRDGQGLLPWMLYARSGDAACLDLARANSLHLRNLALCLGEDTPARLGNPDPWLRKVRGGFAAAPGLLPWQGANLVVSADADPSFLLAMYILEGDLRARGAAAAWADAAGAIPTAGGTAGTMTAVEGLMAVYAVDPQPRYLLAARRLADQLLRRPGGEWALEADAPGLAAYFAYTRDPRVPERLGQLADALLAGNAAPEPRAVRVLIAAALLQKDRRAAILARIDKVLQQAAARRDFPASWADGAWFLRAVPLYLYAREAGEGGGGL